MALAPLTAMFPVVAIGHVLMLLGFTDTEAFEPENLKLLMAGVIAAQVVAVVMNYGFRRRRAPESMAKSTTLVDATIPVMAWVQLASILFITAIWLLRLDSIWD